MTNVFDMIEDFYIQDEGWNTILEQRYAEDFMRRKTWDGISDAELLRIWDDITILCIYLGNAETLLGDMARENFIDCVAWCCRNVSEFLADAENIGRFLDNMADFYAFLGKKKLIGSTTAPLEAKEKLLVDGKLQLLASDGSFLPEYNRYNLYSTPDLPVKIYLNIADRLERLMEALQEFYLQKEFARDMERSRFLYGMMLMDGPDGPDPNIEGYVESFWDYFFFDYHMIDNDMTPVQNFYDTLYGEQAKLLKRGRQRKHKMLYEAEDFKQSIKDVLEELMQAKLILFEVVDKTGEGFHCKNVLTHEHYTVLLPLEQDMDTAGFLFLGHIFYDNTMMMNCVRGMKMHKTARQLFLDVLTGAKDWYAVRQGGNASWDDFLSRNPVLLRHTAMLYAATMKVAGFEYTTNVKDYAPAPLRDDLVSRLLHMVMSIHSFTFYDVKMAVTLWSDYFAKEGDEKSADDDFQTWGAAVLYCLIKVNRVYNYTQDEICQMCYGVSKSKMARLAKKIKTALELEQYDPRYNNEESMLGMLLL